MAWAPAACVALSGLSGPAPAVAQQSLLWDVNGAQQGVGGSGAWNTTSPFWFNGTSYQAWNNGAFDNAVFAGSAGAVAVTLAGTLNAHALAFNVGGYTLTGGTLVFGGLNPSISTQVALATINSALAGPDGFSKEGPTTLVLSGNSTAYTGITRVNGGTLRVDNANALGLSPLAGNLVLADGATFSFNTNFSHNYTLTGGVANVQGGLFTWSGAPTLTASTTLNLNSPVSGGTLSGNLADTGAHVLSITRNGVGRVVLSGANSYTGSTTVVSGQLQIGSAGALSTGSNLVFSGAAGTGGALELTATSGNFTRAAGTLANQVRWTGDGGFLSSGANRIVNLGGAGAQLAWGAGSFVPTGSRLILGTASNHTLDFQNALDLGNGIRSVQGDGGTLSGHARLSGVLSGAGGLNQVGNGILALTGANSYSGGTVMTSGTVLVASNANLGAAAGHLTFNGGTLENTGVVSMARAVTVNVAGGTFRTDADLTTSGPIDGAGRLTKTGLGMLTLTGDGNWAGGTTISTGTLRVGNGATSGSLGGNVVNNAVLAFERADTLSFAGAVSGAGTLQQRGAGTLVLTGESAYAGGTTIAAGTLQVGNGATSGSITGDVANSGVLVFDRSDTAVFAGVVSGTGSLAKRGAGLLQLSGANSHSGGTAVSAGTLRLSDAGTLGAATGTTVVGAGTLDLGSTLQTQAMLVQTAGLVGNGAVDVDTYRLTGGTLDASGTVTASAMFDLQAGTVAGVLTGAAPLAKSTAGTVILTGANTYTGATVISSGTLQLGNGGASGSFMGDVVNNGVLAFNLSGPTGYAGVVSGAGVLEQRGPGVLHLTGNSAAFTGSTSASGGALVVDGNLGGTVNVLSGARLQGAGTVGAANVLGGGTLAPGSPFGTLTVAGNTSFSAGSTLESRTDPAGSLTLLHVTGALALGGGTVNVVTQGSIFSAGARYTLVAADGGRAGQFAAITETLPLLDMVLAYGPNAVYLDVARNSTTLCSLAVTRNQCATSTTDASLGSGNPVFDSVVNLPRLPAIQNALDQLSGEINASVNGAWVADSRFVRDAVLLGSRSTRAWGSYIDNAGRADSDGNAASTRVTTRGVFVGRGLGSAGPLEWGVAAGYTASSLDVAQRSSSSSGDNYHAALYATARSGAVDLRGGTALSLHRQKTHRAIDYPGFSDATESTRSARTVQVFGEAGYPVLAGDVAVEPFAGLAYAQVAAGRFTEGGGAAALNVSPSRQGVGFATLGLKLSGTLPIAAADVRLRGMLGWRRAPGGLVPVARESIGNSTSFEVAGLPMARHTMLIDAGIEAVIARGLVALLAVNGQVSSGRRDSAVRAQLTWIF